MKTAKLVLALFVAACAPPASSSSPSPSPAATTAVPAPSAAPTTAAPIPTPGGTLIPLPTNATLSAAPGGVVWMLVASSHLFRSTDRGTTWEERTVAQQVPIGDIAFVNEREGWISSPVPAATQCQAQSVAIWHTADGAATWERAYQSDLTNDPMCKDGLSFADAQHGFLTLSSPSTSAVIARTADGGRTWTRSQPLPDPPGFTTPGAGFTLRAGRVRAFGATLFVDALGNGAGNGLVYAFRSSDGGATWSYLSTAPTRGGDSIAFVTATRWLQIVPPDNSKETIDAGVSWRPFTTDYRQAAPIAPQIVFGDALVGYATVRGGLQRTTDGGAHWTALKTPGT